MSNRDPGAATPTETGYRQIRYARPPGACEILLVRHGESEEARPDHPFPLVGGQGDPALHPAGEVQARRVAERLAREEIGRVYVSSLRRTLMTAAPLLERLGVEPVVEPDLREVHLGEWEGGAYRRHMREHNPLVRRVLTEERWDVIPGAEPAEAFAARVRGAVGRIAAGNPDRTVVAFTHGGVIGQVLSMAAGSRPFTFVGADNGSISQIVVMGDRWGVRRYNDTAHLHPGFTTLAEPLT